MEGLSCVQRDLHTKILNGFANFKKTPKARLTLSYVETRLEILEGYWTKFEANHQSILIQGDRDKSMTDPYFTSNIYDAVEDCYIEYKSILKETLLSIKGSNKGSQNTTTQEYTTDNNSSVKLPKIVLPQFTGKYMEWPTFHDLFESLICSNQSLHGVQKLHYLKTHLTGEAEQLLRHVPIIEANFERCWQLLKRRYNNKRYIANNILTRLVNQRSLAVESSYALKQLLDTTNDCLDALSNIGIKTDTWDTIIIHLISMKLDNESRKLWENKLSDQHDELPTLKEFNTFLESRFRALEFFEPTKEKRDNKIKGKEWTDKSKVFSITTDLSCPFCSEDHLLYQCNEFKKENSNKRRDFVQNHKLCYNCFAPSHPVTRCKGRNSCRRCGRRHHTLLHTDLNIGTIPSPEGNAASASRSESFPNKSEIHISSNLTYHSFISPGQVLLATALVKIEHKGICYTFRALLDQGSQASFITERVVQMLRLNKKSVKGVISGLGGDHLNLSVNSFVKFKLQSIRTTFNCDVAAYVLNKLSSTLPGKRCHIHNWPELSALSLADPGYCTPNRVDMLLGADIYGQILMDGIIRNPTGTLIAQNTQLGWILSGRVDIQNHHSNNNIISLHIKEDTNYLLRRFWEIETEQPKSLLSTEDQLCENHYQTNTTRDQDGRYVVQLPFRDIDPACKYGDTRSIALQRFKSLERKLSKNTPLKVSYSNVIKEYLDLNHMEAIQDAEELARSDCVYLPHHAVIREDKETTKLRVVFDASCKGYNGRSLNEDLLVGPRLQCELRHLLLRWRNHPICFVADIVKMYRQIKVKINDTNYQRILWRDNPQDNITEYRLLRVTFGVASAPYLAIKSLQQVAKDDGHNYPMAVRRVMEDFYVDDLISGCETETQAVEIYNEITQLLAGGGFTLQKWASNSTKLMNQIRNVSKSEKLLENKQNDVINILGLSWDVSLDSFKYKVNLPQNKELVTKRVVLSLISRLFDPLGWIAPVIIKAKIFMQRLWLTGISWDEALPGNILEEWTTFKHQLHTINNVSVPRWVHLNTTSTNVELHGFCDASKDAYAAVVYLRVVNKMDVHVSLIAARTKVAPIKQVSIPRLELCGAELLAKLLDEVSMVMGIEKDKINAWTDSTIVLAWLKGQPNRWKTFVANRVSNILNILNNEQWAHVESSENPADCASRGLYPTELISKEQWFRGPSWLHNRHYVVPRAEIPSTTLEEQGVKAFLSTLDKTETPEQDTLWTKYSSLQKLVRIVAWCRRFYQKCKDKTKSFPIYLSASEQDEALNTCLKFCQRTTFVKEINHLQRSEAVSRTSSLATLCPFLDDHGLVRVRGRIQQSQENYSLKHPIILSPEHHMSELIVADAHTKTLHGGIQMTLNYLRSKYWIIRAKSLIRRHIRKCIQCIRYAAKGRIPIMGELPKARVRMSRPFSRSGVDFAGPINVRISKGRGCKCYKGYICLFICMATRAIHLEAVSDLTAEGFLAAYKRFVARRGHVYEMWSDNGTNFIGASKELHKLVKVENSNLLKDIANCLASAGTEWHFIPPRSPNFGGLWEAGVKSTKFHLRRILADSTLTFEELSTVLAQVEACLNSRPMYSLPEDQDFSTPLTPSHFLVGEQLVTAPDNDYETYNIGTLRRWQLTQRMLQGFWKRWSQEYLTTLHQRYKWTRTIPEPNIGDVVLVKEDDLPPSKWLLGKIEQKHPGPDNVTRVVTLRCKNSTCKRPISKLIVLPVAS